jgi:hypothetical protein
MLILLNMLKGLLQALHCIMNNSDFRAGVVQSSVVTRLWPGQPEFNFWQGRILLFTAMSRLAVDPPPQLPIQWIPGFFPQGKAARA